jgi:tetratricopeptide (TPR) repeat protein
VAPGWNWRQAALVFGVALGVRVIHIWQLRRAPFFDLLLGDSQSYDDWAQRIVAGDWIGHDVFYQAPLYPYFLAIVYAVFGHSLVAVRLVQACIGSGACVLIGVAAARFFRFDELRGRAVGLIAGLALAFYAPAIFFDALLQKTVLDVFLVCVGLVVIAHVTERPDHVRLWVALGVTMGALSLTRENALVFIVVLAIWAAIVQRPFTVRTIGRRLAGLVAGVVLVVAPVGVRNSIIGGGFYITTSQFGPNLYLGNNPHADGMAGSLRAGRGSPEYERQDATDLAEYVAGRRLTPGEVSSYWTSEALAWIRHDPGAWLKLTVRKIVLLCNRDEVLDTESQESHADWSWPLRALGWVGNFGVLLPLAAMGAYVTRRHIARLWVLYAMAASYAATMIVFYVYGRYRYPLIPLLMLFAAAALARIEIRGVRVFRPAPIAVVLAVAVFANLPILSTDSMRAMTEHNVGAALQSRGRLDEAIDHYRRALLLKPGDAPTYSNLGVALAEKGQRAAAVDSYRRALDVDGDFTDAHYNLGNELLREGRASEAAEQFRRALRGSRGSADVHLNLGLALLDERSTEEGLTELRTAVALSPDSADVHHSAGSAFVAHGRVDEGLEHLRRAVQLAPDDGSAHYDYATTLLENGRAAEAVPELRAALRTEPGLVEARNNLGLALASLNRLDEAIEEFQQALRAQPDFTDARRNLQLALETRERSTAGRPR